MDGMDGEFGDAPCRFGFIGPCGHSSVAPESVIVELPATIFKRLVTGRVVVTARVVDCHVSWLCVGGAR